MRSHPRECYKALFEAAKETLFALAKDPKYIGPPLRLRPSASQDELGVVVDVGNSQQSTQAGAKSSAPSESRTAAWASRTWD